MFHLDWLALHGYKYLEVLPDIPLGLRQLTRNRPTVQSLVEQLDWKLKSALDEIVSRILGYGIDKFCTTAESKQSSEILWIEAFSIRHLTAFLRPSLKNSFWTSSITTKSHGKAVFKEQQPFMSTIKATANGRSSNLYLTKSLIRKLFHLKWKCETEEGK